MNNIDAKLNYLEIFSRYVENIKSGGGDQYNARCPIHGDKTNSFSFNSRTGVCHCFACGWQGNFFSLRAEKEGISESEAFKKTCEENGIEKDQPQKPQKPKQKQDYTLDDYADEKKLPKLWLENIFKLKTGKSRAGTFVEIPYFDESGKIIATRQRHHPSAKPRFTWTTGSTVNFYGLQAFSENQNEVILCEGESDAQTLLFLGFDALGVPGAATFSAEFAKKLAKVKKIFIHVEPDKGGETFLAKIKEKLKEIFYAGEVYKFSCIDSGAKDPSELYLKKGGIAHDEIEALLKNAKKISLADDLPVTISGAPINLLTPEKYVASNDGIFVETDEALSLIIKTPVLISRRLQSIATGEEKIEVMFRRDGKMNAGTFARNTIFSNQGILELAALGATVSSDNGAKVVRYLARLEAENLDRIPCVKSTPTLGWLPDGGFMPYNAGNIILDAHASLERWANSCVKKGSLDAWRETMRRQREKNFRFRFILAASFAAPLLRIVKCRSFLVYNWADSRGGKTATLKASLSAFGDPEKMMVTFNATKVALERMASFFCDIPLGIDERQLAGNAQDGLELIFYMLANGVSRGRGTRDGGIQQVTTWRTVAITTGEEPVQQDNTMTGVATRTIEVVGAPFDTEEEASEMHRKSGENTGHAGAAFVDYLIQQGDAKILERFSEIQKEIEALADAKNAAQVSNLATVALADEIIEELIFKGDRETAREKAIATVEKILEQMTAEQLPDVNISATQFLHSWISENFHKGFEDDSASYFGWFDNDGENKRYFVLPSIIKRALTEGGFSYRKTVKFLKDAQILADPIVKWNRFTQRSVRVYTIDAVKFDTIIATGTVAGDDPF